MQWSDFHPYVMPYVVGCPEPTMVHHARLATIEFCRKTLCLTKTQDECVSDGVTNSIDLFPDTGKQIIKVKSVTVDGKEWPLVTPAHGVELASSDSTDDFAFHSGIAAIEVYPLQAAGTSVVAVAAVAPTLSASTFDDELVPYMQDIALGVIASLQMVPAQEFTNPQHAQVSQAGFNARIYTIAAKIARGQAAAKMRSKTTYL